MKNEKLTEMVFILDRSGSMSGLESDTIGGYNGLIEKQRKEEGEAAVTTVLFDDKIEMLYNNADIGKVKKMTGREYYARGCTALLDAIGKTVTEVGNRHKFATASAVPGKTVVVIITDGFENASREYSLEAVKGIIERQKEKYGWEFLFLGANIDAVTAARDIGIADDRAVTYEADEEGTRTNFEAVNGVLKGVRCCGAVPEFWDEEIKAHHKRKKK